MTSAPDLADQPTRNGEPGVGRRVASTKGLPGGRAIAGGLLVALAGVGTFAAWQRSTGTPDHAFAVADRSIEPGERLTAEHLRFEPVDLPGDTAAAGFTDAGDLLDRVALGPIGPGELLQRGQLSDQGATEPAAEVSFAIDRDRAVDGRLRSGDRIDVFATYDDRTAVVSEGVLVVAVTGGDGGSFTSGRQVTITVALADQKARTDLIHAVRAGDVTLARSTHAAGSTDAAAPSPPGPPPAAPGDEPAPDDPGEPAPPGDAG